jgi:hypothetical protein
VLPETSEFSQSWQFETFLIVGSRVIKHQTDRFGLWPTELKEDDREQYEEEHNRFGHRELKGVIREA